MKKGIDYIGVGVGAIIVNDEQEVFLGKRGDAVRSEAGKWDIPGGGVRHGEKLIEALKRETKEEFDVEIEPVVLLNVIEHLVPDEGHHWISPGYICKVVSGEPKIMEPDKCSEIGWFSLDEMSKMDLTISTLQRMDTLRNHLSEIH